MQRDSTREYFSCIFVGIVFPALGLRPFSLTVKLVLGTDESTSTKCSPFALVSLLVPTVYR